MNGEIFKSSLWYTELSHVDTKDSCILVAWHSWWPSPWPLNTVNTGSTLSWMALCLKKPLTHVSSVGLLSSNVMKGRVYPTIPGLRVSFWFQFSDFTKETNYINCWKNTFYASKFPSFSQKTHFSKWQKFDTKNNNHCLG